MIRIYEYALGNLEFQTGFEIFLSFWRTNIAILQKNVLKMTLSTFYFYRWGPFPFVPLNLTEYVIWSSHFGLKMSLKVYCILSIK